MSASNGSAGASSGASAALETTSMTRAPPIRRPGGHFRHHRALGEAWLARSVRGNAISESIDVLPAEPDPGIEEAVERVETVVDDDEDHGADQHDRLHQGIVAVEDGLDREAADPGPGE